MSKNLTFKGTVNGVEGVFVNADGYDLDNNRDDYIMVCEPNEYSHTLASRHYIQGPAIDRLYEFEQLGMEPEEIIGRLKAAEEYIKEKDKEIEKLRFDLGNNQALIVFKNKTISERDKEIKLLKDTLETYRKIYNADKATISELTDKCENYKDTISKKDAELQRILYMSTRNPYINDGINTSRSAWAEQIVDSNDKLKVENAKLKDKLKKAQGHIVTWRERAEKTWFECNTEIDGLKARNKDLMKMNDELVNRIDNLEVLRKMELSAIYGTGVYSVPDMKKRIEELEAENEELSEKSKGLHDTVRNLRGVKNDYYLTIKQQEAEIHRLRDELRTNSSYDANALKDLKARMETINHLSDPGIDVYVDDTAFIGALFVKEVNEELRELKKRRLK